MGGSAMILQADARAIPLPDESVQCVVTSVPYWNLRRYSSDHAGLIGLEASLDEWVSNLVAVFHEVRRVLRPDGVCFVNCGDAWTSGDRVGHGTVGHKQSTNWGMSGADDPPRTSTPSGLKPKDLIGLGWELARALRADGWWLRSRIIWAKAISFDPNYSGSVMPGSQQDRPTHSFEDIFLLTKSASYFYDGEAEREEGDNTDHPRNVLTAPEPTGGLFSKHAGIRTAEGRNGTGRNLRSVWAINPEGFSAAICQDCWRYWPEGYHHQDGLHRHGRNTLPGAGDREHEHNEDGCRSALKRYCACGSERLLSHYATFPTRLAEACIRLGTSERGCCPRCGAPWERMVERCYVNPGNCSTNGVRPSFQGADGISRGYEQRLERRDKTTGWRQACTCPPAEPVPCLVLDPFAGAGTVGLVARRLGRRAIGLDLSLPYCRLARARIDQDRPLLARVASGVSIQEPLWV